MLILWGIGIVLAGIIANGKDRSVVSWVMLGCLLGIVAPIILLFLPQDGKRCPECAEMVNREAKKCRHCGHVIAEKKTEIPSFDGDWESLDIDSLEPDERGYVQLENGFFHIDYIRKKISNGS